MERILSKTIATSVFVDSHGSITLRVVDFSSVWAVDWDLFIIGSKSVTMSVRIREETALKHLIERWLHSRHQVSRGEGGLFSFSKVVVNISVQDKFPDGNEVIISVRNNLGNIKNVPLIVESVLFRDNLNAQLPFSGLSSIDMVHQISGSIVAIGKKIVGLLGSQVLDSGKSLEVELNPEGFSFLVDPSEGVG